MGHEECVQWIRELARKPEVAREVGLELEFGSFEKFAKRAKEAKGGGPSGRHYGHLIVLAEDRALLRLVFDIIQAALRFGVILERWRIVHQVLVP